MARGHGIRKIPRNIPRMLPRGKSDGEKDWQAVNCRENIAKYVREASRRILANRGLGGREMNRDFN